MRPLASGPDVLSAGQRQNLYSVANLRRDAMRHPGRRLVHCVVTRGESGDVRMRPDRLAQVASEESQVRGLVLPQVHAAARRPLSMQPDLADKARYRCERRCELITCLSPTGVVYALDLVVED